jgi:Protein of unknown function (DUF4038)/Domain of unknown function (DUF5060)
VRLDARFTSPDGQTISVPGFFAGEDRWEVRFNPGQEGRWRYAITSLPHDPELSGEGSFQVTPREARGFLKATPGAAWGFAYENGEPAFLFGDTVYNLFGMAHCGGDVDGFLHRRKDQGFNILRIRVPVSPFHHPAGYSEWQTRRTWAWGGSEQEPLFDRFNLDYFASVERVVHLCEEIGIGIEMIMEGWGFEFPFNHRVLFTAEWEELWMRYLIARFDAFNCLAVWTPLNEYEYYPTGIFVHKPAADRWAIRISRWIKAVAGHGHPVVMHNGPRMPPFAQRFKADPEAVDAIFYQEWGTRDREQGWLAAGIEEQIRTALDGWRGSAVFAEWGYERNPSFELKLPSHQFCDRGHTRRGGWRGVFCGLGIITGFENSWGPWMLLEEDQPGLADLLTLRQFVTEAVPWPRLRPAPELLASTDAPLGYRPMALASAERDVCLAYLPTGGTVRLATGTPTSAGRWFHTSTGTFEPAQAAADGSIACPGGTDPDGHPQDWILVLGA